MMGAFLLGSVVRNISHWWQPKAAPTKSGTWGDLKALAALGAVLVVAVPEFLDLSNAMPSEFYRIALGFMLFYFGSR